jgi:hypothetical protein
MGIFVLGCELRIGYGIGWDVVHGRACDLRLVNWLGVWLCIACVGI